MVSTIFILALFNLALGFGLAVGIAQLPTLLARRGKKSDAVHAEAKHVATAKALKQVAPEHTLPPPPPVVELPSTWMDALEQESVVATSFVEASVQVLRLEVGRYRERLVAVDDEIRSLEIPAPADRLAEIAANLCEINIDWLAKQADAASHLSSKRGNLGAFEEAGHELETVLLDQAAQIETTLSNLQALDFNGESEACRRKLVRELCRLIDLAHILRDRMSDSLLAIMVAEKKVDQIDRKFQFDSLTKLTNRFGLEVILHDWWREDLSRQRLVSCVLVDVDRLAKLNEKHGPRRTDVIIAGFGRWVDDQIRRDRGFDRVIRLSGQSFLLFLGDTGPRNATSAAERLRQTLAATTFELLEEHIELTVSCGVVEIGKKDTSMSLIQRLQQTMRLAKQNGRDRTTLDEGAGPQLVEPPQFQVKARVVPLHDQAA
ncbi:MAG TPA: GGDEF domain-containing protein [Pirellulaceae bacterium]|nr:GGDEF domain-containing protein [Pirellulaceae bacterium]